jgi:hypothetical protein
VYLNGTCGDFGQRTLNNRFTGESAAFDKRHWLLRAAPGGN